MYRIIFLFVAVLMLPLEVSANTDTDTRPRWEAGAGLFGASIPFYRGAADGYTIGLPYPVLKVRGEKYSVDSRDSAKRWFFVNDRFKLHMSLAWGLPVPKGAKGREGLDTLPPSLEFGPKLGIRLHSQGGHAVALKLPLRVGFAADFSGVYYQGWVTAPYLSYLYQTWGEDRWKLSLSSGVRYSTPSYQEFYYGDAAGYRPNGGYGGFWNSLAVYKVIGRFELSLYGRYDFLENASFEESPLVLSKRYFAYGGNLVWWFARSKIRVKIDQRDKY